MIIFIVVINGQTWATYVPYSDQAKSVLEKHKGSRTFQAITGENVESRAKSILHVAGMPDDEISVYHEPEAINV